MHSVSRVVRRLEPLEIYALTLAIVATAAVVSLAASHWTLGPVAVVLPLAAVAAVSERASVTLSSSLDESISLVPTLLVAVLFGPLAAGLVAAVSMVPDLRAPFDRRYLRWGVYTSSRTAAAIATGLAAVWTAHLVVNPYAQLVAATASGALVALSLDVLFAVITIRLRGTASPWELLRTLVPISIAAGLLYAPLVAILAIAYREVSPWTILLFFGPALAAHRLFALYQEQRRLADDLKTANLRLEKANLSFATALVTSLDARDRYTAGHSAAVAIYARDIAARMGLPEEQQRLAQLCGFVHDIGKIGLPPSLLEKPGALTLDERRQMERHSEIGERILSKVEDYAEIAAIVRHHHERVDGHGYPDGLRGADIPILARIIAVADAYNAMTSDRPYRDAMPSRVARMRLAQAVESQFDTTVVAAFEAILAGASEAYKVGGGPAFQFQAREVETVPNLALVSTATA
jgi:putative nucleotidyltransferase with HDIG domain